MMKKRQDASRKIFVNFTRAILIVERVREEIGKTRMRRDALGHMLSKVEPVS